MTPTFELRQSSDGRVWRLSGYASRTGIPYRVRDPGRGPFMETIKRGAFRSTIAAGADVALLVEHTGLPYARTPRTMTLVEDDQGLRVDAELDNADPTVQSLVSKVSRSLLGEMSFSFRVAEGGEVWNGDQRTITALDMAGGDVSVVRTGANRETSVEVTRGAAAGRFEVRSGGPVAVYGNRQMAPDTSPGTPDDADMYCPVCGEPLAGDESECPACGTALGFNDPDSDGDGGRSARAKYSAQELQHMMRLGHALPNTTGQASYPIGDRADVARAVKAVGRGSRSPERIRLHIMKNARRLGATDLIPDTWAADGSLKRSRPSSPTELRRRAAVLRSKAAEGELRELARGLPPTAWDRREALRVTGRIATDARLRGDRRMARALDAAEATEVEAQALGL